MGRSSYLRVSLFYLRLVFVAYGHLAWSFLLTVDLRFGLFCSRWKLGFVFFAYGFPRPEKICSFLLTFPLVRKLGLVLFAYGSPTVSKKEMNRK